MMETEWVFQSDREKFFYEVGLTTAIWLLAIYLMPTLIIVTELAKMKSLLGLFGIVIFGFAMIFLVHHSMVKVESFIRKYVIKELNAKKERKLRKK